MINKTLEKIFIAMSIIVFFITLIIYFFTNNLLLFLIVLTLGIFLINKINIKKFGLLIFITSFFIRLIVISVFKFPQLEDFATLLQASKMFQAHEYSFANWWHFYTWGYQTGFVIYQGLILRIFNSEFLLKILNIIYSSCLVLFIYKLGKKISDEKSARLASFLYMIYPFHLFLNTILANHHLATLLFYLGILFLIKKDKKIKDYIIASILIAFGNIIRPEAIIVTFSLLIYEIFKFNKKEWKKTGINLATFFIIYYLITSLSSFVVIKTNINPVGLKNNDPLWKFVVGFNPDTCGYYNSEDKEYQVSKDEEIKIIKKRLSNIPKTTELMICKINHFWLTSDLESEARQYSNKEFSIAGIKIKLSDILIKIVSVNDYLYLFIFIMFLLGIFINRKKIPDEALFLIILSTVTFFVFLLIEIQPRYAYFIQISIFTLSTLGIKYSFEIYEKYKSILKKKKKDI